MKHNILFLAFIFLFLSACDPFHTKIEKQKEQVISYKANLLKEIAAPTSDLKAMTWNIKFGGGRIDFFFDCFGDRSLMTKEEVISNLDGIIAKIKQVNPDVIFLQEVDIDSKRAAYVDQVQYILDNTDLNYGVYASQWKANYVPSDGIGRMNSGNAILSKWELSNPERTALPLIGNQDPMTQYFYLRRNILTATIKLASSKNLSLVNIHAEAYATDGTKQEQIRLFKEHLDAINKTGGFFLAGGDLNSIPPGTTKTNNFPDNVCTGNFEGEDYTPQLEWLRPLYNSYLPAIPLSEYNANNAKHATFTADKNGFWNRKLDYMFTNLSFEANSGITHQNISSGGMETMPLSDHAPISAKLTLK